jgi:hypothetical protein
MRREYAPAANVLGSRSPQPIHLTKPESGNAFGAASTYLSRRTLIASLFMIGFRSETRLGKIGEDG